MTLHLYNLIFTFFLLGYVPYGLLRGFFQRGFRELAQRLGLVPTLSEERPIWIHAASVGEVLCSIPLLRKMRSEFPGHPVIMTTMTRTGGQTAKTLVPEAKAVFFLPFDHPFTVRAAIKRIRPSLLLIAETEIWPNLLRSCGKKDIPIILFNGRISRKSLKGYLSLKSLFKGGLEHISLFLMQTEEDRNRIVSLGAPFGKTRVMGNLKFDQTFPEVTEEMKASLLKSLHLQQNDPVLIAGSTHAGEEEIVLDLFKKLRAKDSHLTLILAPRHLDRLEEVERILKKEEMVWTRKTFLAPDTDRPVPEPRNPPPIILLDTMGELMRLYSLATLVFIGGSLLPIGGHNPLEPLFYRKCVLFGPHMFHFSEIAGQLIEAQGAIQAKDEEDLAFHAERLLSDERARRELGEKGHQFLLRHRGATEKMYEEIRNFLGGIADRRL